MRHRNPANWEGKKLILGKAAWRIPERHFRAFFLKNKGDYGQIKERTKLVEQKDSQRVPEPPQQTVPQTRQT